jgi:oxygen-independent coproporphyrinogen-3 oxidase
VARLPTGTAAPADGALPDSALAALGRRPFGVYVHVPFCAARCGYCDFNTYIPAESAAYEARSGFAEAAVREVALAREVLGDRAPRASTVFFGGGTPTLLSPAELEHVLAAVDDAFGLEPGAEITTEANPETVDLASLRELRAAGFTRISLGMQSAAPHVLATLDRQHTPGRPAAAAQEAREAGFEHVSLDLIYGAPGETDDDWRGTLEVAAAAGVDHVSAYALIVEEGTRMHARVRRGELPAPDDDAQATRYRIADEVLSGAGLQWYEVSNWARDASARSRHNLLYWHSSDWWGVGPGAHGHVGGVRWWNVLHPARYGERLAAGASPAAGREVLEREDLRTEHVMLQVRLAEGLVLDDAALRAAAAPLAAEGLLDPAALADGRAVLTLDGRLMGDRVARTLLGWN